MSPTPRCPALLHDKPPPQEEAAGQGGQAEGRERHRGDLRPGHRQRHALKLHDHADGPGELGNAPASLLLETEDPGEVALEGVR